MAARLEQPIMATGGWRGLDDRPGDDRPVVDTKVIGKSVEGLDDLEALLQRRQELTLKARLKQEEVDRLRGKLEDVEREAETAWDQAVDMNQVIRDARLRLVLSGYSDDQLRDLIAKYNASHIAV
jgi:hypothetical protein